MHLAERTRLCRLQRKLARAKRGSCRGRRVKSVIAKLRAHEADRRKDWVEKPATGLSIERPGAGQDQRPVGGEAGLGCQPPDRAPGFGEGEGGEGEGGQGVTEGGQGGTVKERCRAGVVGAGAQPVQG